MNRIKKAINYLIYALCIINIFQMNSLFAQTSYKSSIKTNKLGNPKNSTMLPANKNIEEKKQEDNRIDPNTENSQQQPKLPNVNVQTKNEIKTFDPYLDNHLKSPPEGIIIGKFGKQIKVVEGELRLLGAKHYSYAFGKYSKMILSYYIITLNFDVNKRVGEIEIVPKPPLKSIEQKAQDFFIKLFTEGADMSQIALTISSNKLTLKYIEY